MADVALSLVGGGDRLGHCLYMLWNGVKKP
jgi:hypothetical protein